MPAKLTPEQALKRAERGATELDKRRPGWEREVSLSTLDMSRSCKCVIGQLEGSYDGGYNRIFRGTLDGRTAVRRGFTDSADLARLADEKFRLLTNAWKSLIRQRRKSR